MDREQSGRKNGNVSVELIVPVYRPGERLQELLKRMYCQTLLPEKISLLVTGTSQEFLRIREKVLSGEEERRKAAAVCGKRKTAVLPKLSFRRIDPPEFDHGGTRHLGASQSRADFLLFMTEDAVPAGRDLVEALVNASVTPAGSDEIAAVYARQLPFSDSKVLERMSRRYNYPPYSRIQTKAALPRLGIKTYFCSNVCALYRRDLYEKMGGFVGPAIFNEDMVFAASLIRSGYVVAYEASARVFHSHNYSGWQQMRRNFDLGVSQAMHPEVFAEVPSEGEGIRLVRSMAASLCRKGRFLTVGQLVWQSGCKYTGYLLGKHYASLPRFLVRILTMNKRYWEHEAGL